MPRLIGLATAVPPHRYRQDEILDFTKAHFGERLGNSESRLDTLFSNTGIETRHFALPLEWFSEDRTFPEKNRVFVECALDLSERVVRLCLERCRLEMGAVDHIVFVNSTGISAPSLDARLAGRVGFGKNIQRTPIWGLGCAGGAGGINLAVTIAAGDPGARILLVSLELCSLTFQQDDLTKSGLVAAALFADGAAAALIVGDEVRLPGEESGAGGLYALDGGSTLWDNSLDVMGWEVTDEGLRVLFSRDIPVIVEQWLRPELTSFLDESGVSLDDDLHLGIHPGGPRVLEAYRASLGVSWQSLEAAVGVLRDYGNMSSPTCLFVAERLLEKGIAAGEPMLLLALGPGFSAEYSLFKQNGRG